MMPVPEQSGYEGYAHNPPPPGYGGHSQFPMFEQKIAQLTQGHKDSGKKDALSSCPLLEQWLCVHFELNTRVRKTLFLLVHFWNRGFAFILNVTLG